MSSIKLINPLSDIKGCIHNKKVSKENRFYIIEDILQQKHSSAWWSKKLAPIAPTTNFTINNWIYRVKNNKAITGKRGKPRFIEIEDIPDVRRKCRSAIKTKGVRRAAQVSEILNQTAVERYKSNRIMEHNANIKLCRNSIVKYKREANIRDAAAEVGTAARIDAVSDLRSAVALIVACKVMIPTTQYHLICNSDATQFCVGAVKGNKKSCYVADDNADEDVPQQPTKGRKSMKVAPEPGDGGLVQFFIKYYMTVNAAGLLGPSIYIIAHESMKDGEIDPYYVDCMAPDRVRPAWIVFCKTRVPSESFYFWMFEHAFVPWVDSVRSLYKIPNNRQTWYQIDGEKQQIAPFQDAHIFQLCTEKNITVGKSNASRTEVDQACDAGNCFKAAKARLKNITDTDVAAYTDEMGWLKEVYTQHMQKYGEISSQHQSMGKKGLLRVRQALGDTINPEMITKSFIETGIRTADRNNYGFDSEKILQNCTTPMSPELKLEFFTHGMNKLATAMSKKGELCEKDFDKVGIPQSTTIRDEDRKTYNKRYCILTNNTFFSNEQSRIADEETAARERAINQEANKQKRAANKAKKDAQQAKK